MDAFESIEIDGYRVEFERGQGWRCPCGDFDRSNVCEHTLLLATTSRLERVLPDAEEHSDVQYLAIRRTVDRSK